MWNSFSTTIGASNLQLITEPASAARLQSRLGDLKGYPDKVVVGGGGVSGDAVRTDYIFDLGKKATTASLRIKFHDYPGKYLSATAAPDQTAFIQELVKNCVAVFIPIDTPALMEQDGRWHETINRPGQLANLVMTAYMGQTLSSPRLLILAPVRCERYLQDKRGDEVLTRIQSEYKALLDHIGHQSLRPHVAAVVTPVQTVGAVRFSRITEENQQPVFHFTKRNLHAKFQPEDGEQPLRYLLRFLLRLHREQRKWGVSFLDWLRDWFGSDTHLKAALEEFAGKSKASSPFAILQGDDLLRWN